MQLLHFTFQINWYSNSREENSRSFFGSQSIAVVCDRSKFASHYLRQFYARWVKFSISVQIYIPFYFKDEQILPSSCFENKQISLLKYIVIEHI